MAMPMPVPSGMVMKPASQCIIFDLDGTLIDSSASILKGFANALESHEIAPKLPLTAALIGPPLRQTLSTLTGISEPSVIDSLASAFMTYYDSEGYKATEAFTGVDEMLRSLVHQGRMLHIATNKRQYPTLRIVEHLGWSELFASVWALDCRRPPYPSKAAMIASLLAMHEIDPASAAYVGDRPEDGEAADANALPFFAADWGYSSFPDEGLPTAWVRLTAPGELPGYR
ncbi:MAG: haloacid dehalogenase [Betaproteobacteria bacterium]|nr:haloacid dehalogenase [Betaproteobacteria bacterium]